MGHHDHKIIKFTSRNRNRQILNFTSNNRKIHFIPIDYDYLLKWGAVNEFRASESGYASYFRGIRAIVKRGKDGKCSSALDVLSWFMNKVEENKSIAMITYGNLIHLYREKNFINQTTGK